MKIGQLAKLTGVSVDALRFYEEKGLIKPTTRSESGYRHYAPGAVAQIGFLKTAQALGFSLQEIAEVMPALTDGELILDDVKQKMQAKLTSIDQQIERLQQLRQQIQSSLLLFQCDASTVLSPHNLIRPADGLTP